MIDPKADRIRRAVLQINPSLTDDALSVVVPAVLLREGFVSDMAASSVCSPEWNEASRRIVECEVIMAKFGLI